MTVIVYIDGQNIPSEYAESICNTIYSDINDERTNVHFKVYLHTDDLLTFDDKWVTTSKKFNMKLITTNTLQKDVTKSMTCDILTDVSYSYYLNYVVVVSNSRSFEPVVGKVRQFGGVVYGMFTSERARDKLIPYYNDYYDLSGEKIEFSSDEDSETSQESVEDKSVQCEEPKKVLTPFEQFSENLDAVESFLSKNGRRPSIRGSTDEKKLSNFLTTCMRAYDKDITKCKGSLKQHLAKTRYEELRKKYPRHFESSEETYLRMLREVELFIEQNRRLPMSSSEEKKQKRLGEFLTSCKTNYHKDVTKCKGQMKHYPSCRKGYENLMEKYPLLIFNVAKRTSAFERYNTLTDEDKSWLKSESKNVEQLPDFSNLFVKGNKCNFSTPVNSPALKRQQPPPLNKKVRFRKQKKELKTRNEVCKMVIHYITKKNKDVTKKCERYSQEEM